MNDVFNRVVAAIEAANTKPAQKSGKGVRLQCPAHGGNDRNLYIADGASRLIMVCHSHHCDPKDILESVGLSIKDIYYKPLTPQEKTQHKILVNDRQLKSDLEIELLILLQWLSAFYESMFPIDNDADRSRVLLAMQRIQKVTEYYLKRGV